jgi:hypothetical protein
MSGITLTGDFSKRLHAYLRPYPNAYKADRITSVSDGAYVYAESSASRLPLLVELPQIMRLRVLSIG